jgi:putative transposase
MLWKLAGFCGLEIVTYCVMANHFHVLLRVPEPPQLSDEQLLERLEALYGKKGALTLLARQALKERGCIYEDVRARLLERMGDVSAFMKELKQRFSRWFNHRHDRFGTLWAERFKSVVVEDSAKSMVAVAAYIDLNPVRAGLVQDPKDYRFCGYAAALGGNKLARQGLLST